MYKDYLFFYIESMIVCGTVFVILFAHDMLVGARDERKMCFDNVLVVHILYFAADCYQASLKAGTIPRTLFSVSVMNFILLVLLALLAATWFTFALASLEIPWRLERKGKLMKVLPAAVTIILSFVITIVDPSLLVDEDLNDKILFQVLFLAAPIFYIIYGFILSMREAIKKENLPNRSLFFLLGIYPVTILIAGIIQILLLDAPFFCFNSMIMIILFNLLSMDSQISTDPLTKLNNRGQMMRFAMQDSSLHKEGLRTFVIMADANNFKKINDTYGHVEGDRALVTIADSLKKVASEMEVPPFIARFGGDEFVMIIYTKPDVDASALPGELLDLINSDIAKKCVERKIPYPLAMTLGCDEITDGDNFQASLENADVNLYRAKKLAGVGR